MANCIDSARSHEVDEVVDDPILSVLEGLEGAPQLSSSILHWLGDHTSQITQLGSVVAELGLS